jgi:hypothetical protein
MTEFIEGDVKALYGSGSADRVRLLVGYEGDDSVADELEADIEALDGEVIDHVGRVTLRVELPESQVESLCNLSDVVSVERDKRDVDLQDGTDFQPRTSSMM